MDEFEKQIYNTYLIVSRSISNKPFRTRKDFTGFEKKPEYLAVKKLASFFKKHRHLNINSFFEAPFFIYNEDYFSIDFYCTYKAISTYTKYNDNFLIDNPDSKVGNSKIKESILFITNFCKKNNIKLSDYIKHTDGNYYSFLNHIKDRQVNVYVMFAFPNFEQIIQKVSPDIKKLLVPALLKVDYLRTKIYSSTRMKKNINLFKKYVENR